MRYDRDTVLRVRERMAEKRRAALLALELRRAQAYEKQPRLREIELEISRVSARLSRDALRDGGPDGLAALIAAQTLELRATRAELLTEAGLPANALQPAFECARCGDEGYVGADMCDCFKAALREEAMRGSVLAPLLGTHTFDNFELSLYSAETDLDFGISPRANMERVLRFMRRFADTFPEDGGSILLQGYTGLGKTHLSLAVAGELISRGFHVVYGSVGELVGMQEEARFRASEQAARRAAAVMECDLLIMDDLGAEFSTSFSQAAIFDIINARTAARRATIISTNCTMRELRDIYSDKTVSRIVGAFRLITVFGEDIRQLTANA